MDEWKRILLEGRLITETAAYGASQWAWLGGYAFEILPVVPLTQILIKVYPRKIQELIMHLMLYWKEGFYKSTMIKAFCNLILSGWNVGRIGQSTVPAIRGSVLLNNRKNSEPAVFIPPVIINRDIVFNTEFHELLANKALQSNLQTWLGDQEITNATAHVGKLSASKKQLLMKIYPGLTFNASNSYTLKVPSSFISGCNTASVDVSEFDSSTYDRMGVLSERGSDLDENLAAAVDMLSRHPPPDDLVKAWSWISSINIEGELPEIPVEWKRKLSGLPRMRARVNYMIRAYSVAYLPMEHGYLSTEDDPYEMILSERAFDLAQIIVEDLKAGQRRMKADLRSGPLTGIRARRNAVYNDYIEEHILDDLTCKGFSDYFNVTTEAARRQFRMKGLVPRGRRWVRE